MFWAISRCLSWAVSNNRIYVSGHQTLDPALRLCWTMHHISNSHSSPLYPCRLSLAISNSTILCLVISPSIPVNSHAEPHTILMNSYSSQPPCRHLSLARTTVVLWTPVSWKHCLERVDWFYWASKDYQKSFDWEICLSSTPAEDRNAVVVVS